MRCFEIKLKDNNFAVSEEKSLTTSATWESRGTKQVDCLTRPDILATTCKHDLHESLPFISNRYQGNNLRCWNKTVKQLYHFSFIELAQSIRQEVDDYKKTHQAVSQQAKEAVAAILDIPVFQDKVKSLKSQIRKRAVAIEKEYKKAKRGSEELPSILKEYFKRNDADIKGETRLSRSHRDLNL